MSCNKLLIICIDYIFTKNFNWDEDPKHIQTKAGLSARFCRRHVDLSLVYFGEILKYHTFLLNFRPNLELKSCYDTFVPKVGRNIVQ